MRGYCIAGLEVHSDIALGGSGAFDLSAVVPDIVIKCPFGPTDVAGLEQISPVLWARTDGLARFKLDQVCECIIFGGRFIGIMPDPRMGDADLRSLIMGPLMAIIGHQRGLLPLQGTCVMNGGRAILLLGPPGVGKSALAVGLERRDYNIISDDICIFYAAGDRVHLLPTMPQVKIWSDTIDALGIPQQSLTEVCGGHRRFLLRCSEPKDELPDKISIERILFIERGNTERPTLNEIDPAIASSRIISSICNLPFTDYTGLTDRQARSARLLAETTQCAIVSRRVVGDLNAQISYFEELL